MLDAWGQSHNRLIPTDEVSWNQMPGSVWCGVAWRVMAWRGVAWCAEGAVTKGQWPPWVHVNGRAVCVARALCASVSTTAESGGMYWSPLLCPVVANAGTVRRGGARAPARLRRGAGGGGGSSPRRGALVALPGVVWCAEGAITKWQRPGCLPTGTGKRAGLCVCCARCV